MCIGPSLAKGAICSFLIEQNGKYDKVKIMVSEAPATKARSDNSGSTVQVLSELETESVDLFVRMAQVLGLPKSVGELYGLLFISTVPLSMDELMSRLDLSKGSTSQGLKQLRNYGAIRTVYIPGDRRDHYVAELELRKLVAGFLREQVQPNLLDNGSRFGRMETFATKLGVNDRKVVATRIHKLKTWQTQGQKIIPVIVKLLGV